MERERERESSPQLNSSKGAEAQSRNSASAGDGGREGRGRWSRGTGGSWTRVASRGVVGRRRCGRNEGIQDLQSSGRHRIDGGPRDDEP